MSAAPPRRLRAGGRTLCLGDRPLLMGVVNASPDSFSDPGRTPTLDSQLRLARELVEAGADIVDVGGESGVTDRPPVDPGEEIERIVPLVERLTDELDVLVSVDTYKPAVAQAAVAAGAEMVNDVSGLSRPELADVCARTGAALVITHTVGAPKQKILDHDYGDVGADVTRFLRERIELACERRVATEQLMLDPGPDFGKSPAQTVEALIALPRLHELGRPLLLAVSRKDFVGALTGRAPRERLAGTLAALAHGVEAGAHVLRVHDVAAAADFLAVRAALRGEREVPGGLRLAPRLRREPRPAGGWGHGSSS
ncbi:MAG: dihydropteroate synthase [Solirubrobacteraceae bacterium]